MSKTSLLCAAALAAAVATPAAQAGGVDVGVSIGISQPGVYGRIDIGRFPQPQVVMPQPVIIVPPPPPPRGTVVLRPARPEPVYLWVPPGHRKDWRKHCGKYDACGVPVYFVRDEWYERHVEPRERWHDKDRGRGHGKGHGKGRGRDD